MIEFAILFPMVLTMGTALLSLILIFGTVHTFQFIGEETLFCSLHSASETCEHKAREVLEKIPLIQISQLQIERYNQRRKVTLAWSFSPFADNNKNFGSTYIWEADTNAFDQR